MYADPERCLPLPWTGDSALASRLRGSSGLLMNESSPQRQLGQCWVIFLGCVVTIGITMNRIGKACPNRPVYFHLVVSSDFYESRSQFVGNLEREYMWTAVTGAPCWSGVIGLAALVSYCWANLPLALLMQVQALEALTGHPTIKHGQPCVGHYNGNLGMWERCYDPGASAFSLVCPLVMGRWSISQFQDALLATCHCSQHGQWDILAECQLSIARWSTQSQD